MAPPPGVCYQLDFPDASDDRVVSGGGGFLIFARDGAIVEFGSGEFAAAWGLGKGSAVVVAPWFRATTREVARTTQEVVRRLLADRGAT